MASLYPKRVIITEPFSEQLDVIDKTLIEAQNQPSMYAMKRKPFNRFKPAHSQGMPNHMGMMNNNVYGLSNGNGDIHSGTMGAGGMLNGPINTQTIQVAPTMAATMGGSGVGVSQRVTEPSYVDYSAYLNGSNGSSYNGYQSSPSPTGSQQFVAPSNGGSLMSSNTTTGSTNDFFPSLNPPTVFDPFSSKFDNSNLLSFKHNNLSSNIWGNSNSGSISADTTVWG